MAVDILVTTYFVEIQNSFVLFQEKQEGDSDFSEWCNGSKYFCNMNFRQFLFPGIARDLIKIIRLKNRFMKK